jgi:hypothetical protein
MTIWTRYYIETSENITTENYDSDLLRIFDDFVIPSSKCDIQAL